MGNWQAHVLTGVQPVLSALERGLPAVNPFPASVWRWKGVGCCGTVINPHRDVMRGIRNLIDHGADQGTITESNFGLIGYQKAITVRNFALSEYEDTSG
ncbi:hypothetical protein [Desulfurivibrio sp. C05AmB]|uniref:hypothetical protein n=1 Tax=Desulfurivibrio sp. C05AmB TaxID=3374371 RepID=UPI00376EAE3D